MALCPSAINCGCHTTVPHLGRYPSSESLPYQPDELKTQQTRRKKRRSKSFDKRHHKKETSPRRVVNSLLHPFDRARSKSPRPEASVSSLPTDVFNHDVITFPPLFNQSKHSVGSDESSTLFVSRNSGDGGAVLTTPLDPAVKPGTSHSPKWETRKSCVSLRSPVSERKKSRNRVFASTMNMGYNFDIATPEREASKSRVTRPSKRNVSTDNSGFTRSSKNFSTLSLRETPRFDLSPIKFGSEMGVSRTEKAQFVSNLLLNATNSASRSTLVPGSRCESKASVCSESSLEAENIPNVHTSFRHILPREEATSKTSLSRVSCNFRDSRVPLNSTKSYDPHFVENPFSEGLGNALSRSRLSISSVRSHLEKYPDFEYEKSILEQANENRKYQSMVNVRPDIISKNVKGQNYSSLSCINRENINKMVFGRSYVPRKDDSFISEAPETPTRGSSLQICQTYKQSLGSRIDLKKSEASLNLHELFRSQATLEPESVSTSPSKPLQISIDESCLLPAVARTSESGYFSSSSPQSNYSHYASQNFHFIDDHSEPKKDSPMVESRFIPQLVGTGNKSNSAAQVVRTDSNSNSAAQAVRSDCNSNCAAQVVRTDSYSNCAAQVVRTESYSNSAAQVVRRRSNSNASFEVEGYRNKYLDNRISLVDEPQEVKTLVPTLARSEASLLGSTDTLFQSDVDELSTTNQMPLAQSQPLQRGNSLDQSSVIEYSGEMRSDTEIALRSSQTSLQRIEPRTIKHTNLDDSTVPSVSGNVNRSSFISDVDFGPEEVCYQHLECEKHEHICVHDRPLHTFTKSLNLNLSVVPGIDYLQSLDPENLSFMAYFSFLPVLHNTCVSLTLSDRKISVTQPNELYVNNSTFTAWEDAILTELEEPVDTHLSRDQTRHAYEYKRWLRQTLEPVSVYYLWGYEENYRSVTKPWAGQHGAGFWNRAGDRTRTKLMNSLNLDTSHETEARLERQAATCFGMLSAFYSDRPYFFGETPSSVDAEVFGLLAPVLFTGAANGRIQGLLRQHEPLVSLVLHVKDRLDLLTSDAASPAAGPDPASKRSSAV